MKSAHHLSPRQQKLFTSLGIIYIMLGAAALLGYFVRDIFGLEIGIHGDLIPLGLLMVVGAGLLFISRDHPHND